MSSAALRSVALRRSAPVRISRPRGEGGEVGERDVLVDRRFEHQARSACGPPARGRCRGRWRRAACGWRPSGRRGAPRPPAGAVDAEDGAGELGAAGADQARHAEDLAARAAQGRSRASGCAGVRTPAISSTGRPAARVGRDVERFQVAADHHADHGVVPDLAARQLAHDRAVAQHHDAVGALLDLVQAVRDEDHRHAAGLELGDHLQEARRLRGGEARGRLVHDDDARVERQRLDDLDELALRERQLGDRRVRLEVDAEPAQQRRHLGLERRAVDQPQRPAEDRLAADHDVGRDVEIVEEVELLVHEGDARRHGAGDRERGVLDAVDADRAFARLDDAAQDLHQGRLAGAVLADQRQHLAALDARG